MTMILIVMMIIVMMTDVNYDDNDEKDDGNDKIKMITETKTLKFL